MNGNGGFQTKLPTLDGKNWERWCIQMRVLFGAQEVLDIVNDGYVPLAANPTEAQRNANREAKKKDQKALFYIHQCVDAKAFDKIADATTSKAAWDTLVKCYGGDAKVKKVRLQALRRQYELLQQNEDEKIAEYFARLQTLTNQMKNSGETLSDEIINEKVLRTLNPSFDHIVVAIEESKDLSELNLEDLQSSLEAHELRVLQRKNGRDVDQALQAKVKKGEFGKKSEFEKKKWQWKQKNKNQNQNVVKTDDKPESSNRKGGGGFNKQKYKKKVQDKRGIQCFNCDTYGHYADECWTGKGKKKQNSEEEANVADCDSEVDPVMLMVTTTEGHSCSDEWYLDTGCSNHMTSRRDWLSNFDSSKRTRIKVADGRSLQAEGMGNILIQGKGGKTTLIEEVWYVPAMNCNLMSVG